MCGASASFRNVVNFHYNGRESIKEKPLWPSEIVEENIVLDNLKAKQDMRLVFVDLTHSLCKYENGEEGVPPCVCTRT